MKKLLWAILIAGFLLSTSNAGFARGEKQATARVRNTFLSKKGYWVIQQNAKEDQRVIVFYYNNFHNLVKKESRTRRMADTRRAKVRRSLKRSLEEALDWSEIF